MPGSILLRNSPAAISPADSAERREPSRVADKSLLKLWRRTAGPPSRQRDRKLKNEHPVATCSCERVPGKCAKAAGEAIHRAAGDEIRAGNSQSSRAAVARNASPEAVSRFRYRQIPPFSAQVKKQDSSEIHPDNFATADSHRRAWNVLFLLNTQDFTNLRVGHPLNMEHGYHGSVFIRQFHHGLVQSSLQLRQVRFSHWTARRGQFQEFFVVLNARVHVIQTQLKPAAALLEKIQRHIYRDRMNPGIKGRFTPEPADRFVRLGKNILQKVIRILVVRGHVVDQTVQTRRIFDD